MRARILKFSVLPATGAGLDVGAGRGPFTIAYSGTEGVMDPKSARDSLLLSAARRRSDSLRWITNSTTALMKEGSNATNRSYSSVKKPNKR